MASSPDRWQAFRCPKCGRVTSYSPEPAGPGKPQCTYGHYPVVMEAVAVSPGCRGAELAEAADLLEQCFRIVAPDELALKIEAWLAAFRASGEAGPDPFTEVERKLKVQVDECRREVERNRPSGQYERARFGAYENALRMVREALSGGVVG